MVRELGEVKKLLPVFNLEKGGLLMQDMNVFNGEEVAKANWKCIKCGCTSCESDQFQATGGGLAKAFDVQNKKFYVVSCTKCGYSELYKKQSSTMGNIADFMFNQ